jgi:hypothetical protein
MGMTCSTHGGKRNAYRILIGKPEGKITRKNWTYVGGMILKCTLERWDGVD